MLSRYGRLLVGVLTVAGFAGLGAGCSTVSKAEYEAAVSESLELRDQVSTLRAQLTDCESRYSALASQGASQPTGGRSTGLEGIGGTNGSVRAGDVVVSIVGDVLFDSGSNVLKADAKRSLDQVASVLRARYPGHSIRVEGYSDSDPIKKSKWETNERLSGERAMAVEAYLVSKGISKDQIYYAGFGTAIAKESKAKSRRVEIVVLAGADGF